MFSAKQGHHWYHFYNVFGMTRSLTGDGTRGPPALEASTIPLGYRGDGNTAVEIERVFCVTNENSDNSKTRDQIEKKHTLEIVVSVKMSSH